MDCRICGDPNSAMRFAFIEFLEEAGAHAVRVCCACAVRGFAWVERGGGGGGPGR
jgi:hypothetical protein